jgi:hypothetical protein
LAASWAGLNAHSITNPATTGIRMTGLLGEVAAIDQNTGPRMKRSSSKLERAEAR